MAKKIDISTSTFIRLILILLAIGFLFLIRDVLVILFIVLIIVAGLSPIVERWEKNVGRTLAVVALFALIVSIIALIFSVLLPPLVVQLQDFANNLPKLAESFSNISTNGGYLSQSAQVIAQNLNSLSAQLTNFGVVLFTQTLGLISGIVALITVFVLSFYLLIDESGIKRVYQGLIPSRYYDNLAETTRKIAVKLGAWLRGQLLMMLSVAGIVTIGLLLSGTPYALTLGIWAGLTEVVPIIGPWLGAIPGVIVALTVSPWHGLIALIIYILVQQFESNFLVPRIMSKAVGLNPVVVIIALLIGGKLYGILGVLLGVPLAAVVSVVVEDWPVLEETFTTSRSK